MKEDILNRLKKEFDETSSYDACFNKLISTGNTTFDFSRNYMSLRIFNLITELANVLNIKTKIKGMFSDEILNPSERRKVSHVFLRAGDGGESSLKKMILENKEKMYQMSRKIRSGEYLGYTGKEIKNIVHIGIGGSEKGVKLINEIYRGKSKFNVFFVSNIDGFEIERVLKECALDETIFIYCSKSGKTEETYENASYFKKFFFQTAGEDAFKKHFFGVSSNFQAMVDFGISEKNILEFPIEIGGRFSIFSPISFVSVISYGEEFFESLLKGAKKGDTHFLTKDWGENIPFLMGSLSWWYTRFFDLRGVCVLPYSTCLKPFIEYYQQLEMESNGKNLDINGEAISYRSTNIVWGDCGTNAQHSFFQYLCQTKDFILGEFIGVVKPNVVHSDFNDLLMSHFFCQMDLFFEGFKEQGVKGEYKIVEGRKPVFGILLHDLEPETVGEFLAFYEHRIFIEGLFHEINSFDQWAVEIGKKNAISYRKQERGGRYKNHLFEEYLKLKT